MQLTAIFETWHIGDGNYPPLRKGQLVNLSFEVEPSSLSKSSSLTVVGFGQVKDAEYRFGGTVLKVYTAPTSTQIVVIQAADFRFFMNSFRKGMPSLEEGDYVEGYGRLLLDHYTWVEYLSTYRDHPDLFYPLRVSRIRSVKIPDSLISHSERGVSGPTSLWHEAYSTAAIEEIERMDNFKENWNFYLVDFDSSDVGTARIPRTFQFDGCAT